MQEPLELDNIIDVPEIGLAIPLIVASVVIHRPDGGGMDIRGEYTFRTLPRIGERLRCPDAAGQVARCTVVDICHSVMEVKDPYEEVAGITLYVRQQ